MIGVSEGQPSTKPKEAGMQITIDLDMAARKLFNQSAPCEMRSWDELPQEIQHRYANQVTATVMGAMRDQVGAGNLGLIVKVEA